MKPVINRIPDIDFNTRLAFPESVSVICTLQFNRKRTHLYTSKVSVPDRLGIFMMMFTLIYETNLKV